jgi:hypothetical protein
MLSYPTSRLASLVFPAGSGGACWLAELLWVRESDPDEFMEHAASDYVLAMRV